MSALVYDRHGRPTGVVTIHDRGNALNAESTPEHVFDRPGPTSAELRRLRRKVNRLLRKMRRVA